MKWTKKILMTLFCLAIVAGSSIAFAQPGNGHGGANGNGVGNNENGVGSQIDGQVLAPNLGGDPNAGPDSFGIMVNPGPGQTPAVYTPPAGDGSGTSGAGAGINKGGDDKQGGDKQGGDKQFGGDQTGTPVFPTTPIGEGKKCDDGKKDNQQGPKDDGKKCDGVQCKDNGKDENKCDGAKCDNKDKDKGKHHDDDNKCHRHDRPNKPEKPDHPVVIETTTVYYEIAPVYFAAIPEKLVINEAGACVELYSVNVDTFLSGYSVVENGVTLLAFDADSGIIVSGDHPVFDWQTAPTTGTLCLVDPFGNVVDTFNYVEPTDLANDSAQRIPDGSSVITIAHTTWQEANHL